MAKLQSPTCVKCARAANLMSIKASYTSELGVCQNCGIKTWVSPVGDWYRVKAKASGKKKAAARG